MRVSTLILTFNEERNLPRCLGALHWCDDVIVVDSGSTDSTVAIARSFGARVLHRHFDDFSSQRNFGLETGSPRYEWVLHLDADEVVTEEFAKALEILEPESGIDAYQIPSKTIFHEYWIRYAGMYPTYQVRLGHRDRLRFKQVGHGQREDLPPSRVGIFNEPYLHYNFSQGLAAWLQKHVKYAQNEAKLLASSELRAHRLTGSVINFTATERRRALKLASARLPLILRPMARFFYVLVLRRGFLDGRYGLLYAFMLSVYESMIAIFTIEASLRAQVGLYTASRVAEGGGGNVTDS